MAASAGIILPQQTVANTTIPAAGSINLFANSAGTPTAPAPYWLDSSGVAHSFGTMESITNFTVYNVQDYGVLPSATAATNSTQIAALIALATSGSVIYFPSGTYQFASAIAVGSKAFRFMGNGQNNTVLQTTSATADLFTLTDAQWYTEFWDLAFGTTITKTAGNMITTGTAAGSGNVGINIRRCTFGNPASTFNIFNGILYAGTNSGNITVIEGCNFGNFANFGISIIGNTSTPNSACNMAIRECTMNGALAAGNSVAGIQVSQCGSILLANLDIVSCATNILVNPATGTSSGVFSIFAVNCFFDQATVASLAMSGTGFIQRCTFIDCWFTTSSAASTSAVLINSTATTLPTGLKFSNCSVYNTNAAATAFGFNLTGIKDVTIEDCNIAGWNDAIAVTPGTAAGTTTLKVCGGTIGPVGGIALNTVGILINAGSFTYNSLIVQDVNLQGNTTALTDNSTGVSGSKWFTGNPGYNPHSAVTTPTFPTSTTVVTNTTGVPVTAYVKGGTLTVITVGGVATGIAGAIAAADAYPIPLAPMQTIAITFSVAPTWVWVGA